MPRGKRRNGGRARATGFALASVASVVLAVLIATDATRTPPACTRESPQTRGKKVFSAPPCMQIDDENYFIATMETSLGTIRLQLEPRLAQDSVNNFVFLARQGFYDGQIFHRVERSADYALVQTGDPTGTGRGGPGYTYQGEPPSPITQYTRGTVAMANTGSPSSNGSQFFIIVRDYEALSAPESEPNYTFFGIVADADSLKVLDRMTEVPLDGTKPITPVRLIRVTVEEVERFPEDDTASPSPSGTVNGSGEGSSAQIP